MSRRGIARPVVLLVDDNDAARGLLQFILQDHYEVISVSSGEAGLREVAQRHVDMVLLDLLMPGMGGWEVFERLRGMSGRRPKVIFLTGVDSSVAAVAALKLGAEDWVVKPFDESVLLRQLRLLFPTARPIRIQGGELGDRQRWRSLPGLDAVSLSSTRRTIQCPRIRTRSSFSMRQARRPKGG